MTENITLTRDDATATALIRHERSTSKIRYAQYVSEHGVTLETVPAHVQALANLAGEIRKWESGAERKAFCNKIRGGLKHHLTPAPTEAEVSDADADEAEGEESTEESADAPKNLLTRAGLAAPLEDVIAAWKAANEASA